MAGSADLFARIAGGSTPQPPPTQPVDSTQPQPSAQGGSAALFAKASGAPTQHFGSGSSTPGNLSAGHVPGLTAADNSQNALLPTLRFIGDRLSTGQYISANVLEDVLNKNYGDLWNAVKQGATGQRRGDYIDIIKQHFPNLDPHAAAAIGFALDVGLDPTTYLTFGEGALVKATLPKVGKVGGEVLSLGTAPNVGGAIVNKLSGSSFGRDMLRTFHPAGEWAALGGDALGKDYLQTQRVIQHAHAGGIAQNVPLANAQRATEAATGMSPSELSTVIEKKTVPKKLVEGAAQNEAQNVATNPPEGVSLPEAHPQAQSLKDQFHSAEQQRLANEKAAGIDVNAVTSDVVDYLSHQLTPEARAWAKKNDINMKTTFEGVVQHGSTKQRVMDMPVTEANALSEAGQLGGTWKGFQGKLFIDDPAVANTLRDIISIRSIAAADFIKRVASDPKFAEKIGPGGHPPPGFRQLSETAQKRYGPLVGDVAFRSDVADALDRYTAYVSNPDELDQLSKAYQWMIRTWKPITLGSSPKWMVNNAGTNTFMLWLAGASPKALAKARTVFAKSSASAPAVYRIQPGDTLSQIAEKFGVDTATLAKKNGIADPNAIAAGRVLAIPVEGGKIGGFTPSQVFQLAQQQGILFGGLYGSAAQDAIEGAIRSGLYGEKQGKNVVQKGMRLILDANTALENYSRMTLFVDGLQKGMKPEEAAQRVDKYLGNFAQMSKAGKAISAVVPFWSWIRFAMPRMLEQLKTHPGRQAVQFKAIDAMQANQPYVEPRAVQRDYEQNQLKAQVGYSPTTPREMSMNSAMPLSILTGTLPTTDSHTLGQAVTEMAGNLIETLGAGANPFYNAAQALRGYDVFTNREIPVDATTNLFGSQVNQRLATAAEELFPPLAAANRAFSPHTATGVNPPSIGMKALNTIANVKDRPMVTLKPTLGGAKLGGDVSGTVTHLNTLVDQAVRKAEIGKAPAERKAAMDQAQNLAKQIVFVMRSVAQPNAPPQVMAALGQALSGLSRNTQNMVSLAMLEDAAKARPKAAGQ